MGKSVHTGIYPDEHMKKKLTTDAALGHFDYETVVMGMEAGNSNDYDAFALRDVRLKRLKETVRFGKSTILDIGCGGGTITNFLAHTYPQSRVYGCDVSRQAIRLAKKYGQPRTWFGVIKNGKFPYKSNFFDACICFDVLEHVPDVAMFLSETRRVLKKGGIIYFAIPCEGQFFSLTWFLQKLRFGDTLTYKHVGHIHPEFTHRYVRRLFEQNKFTVLHITYAEHFLTQCVRFIRFILPKEALEFFLGSHRAEKYYDRSIVTASTERKPGGFFVMLRRLWLGFGVVFDLIENADALLFKHIPFTAWKVLLYAKKTS